MELLQLRYFRALAKNEQLTKTAHELMVSPPALSATISKLEKELGVLLFDRVGRSIRLNANGKLFLNYVDSALLSLDNGISAMEDISGRLNQPLSVALTSFPIYQEALENYRTLFPDVRLSWQVVNYAQLISGDLDFDFFLGAVQDIDTAAFQWQRLMPDEQPCVIMSASHPLASRREVSMLELKEETFATLGDSNPAADKHLSFLCATAGFFPKHTLSCDYFSREKALAKNKCIAISTDLGYKTNYLPRDTIVHIPITQPRSVRTQCVAWRKGRYLTQLHQGFISYLTEYYKDVSFS